MDTTALSVSALIGIAHVLWRQPRVVVVHTPSCPHTGALKRKESSESLRGRDPTCIYIYITHGQDKEKHDPISCTVRSSKVTGVTGTKC